MGECDRLVEWINENKSTIQMVFLFLAFLIGIPLLIGLGNAKLQEAIAFKESPSTSCTVTSRYSVSCRCGDNCRGEKYHYEATAYDLCGDMTLQSTIEKCQKNGLFAPKHDTVSVGGSETCYIDDCASGEFAFGWAIGPWKTQGIVMIISGSFLLVVFLLGICYFVYSYFSDKSDYY